MISDGYTHTGHVIKDLSDLRAPKALIAITKKREPQR